MDSLLTPHARTRMQQRGIRPEMLEALLDFGRVRSTRHGGREIVFFDKRARARLAKAGLARELRRSGFVKATRCWARTGS